MAGTVSRTVACHRPLPNLIASCFIGRLVGAVVGWDGGVDVGTAALLVDCVSVGFEGCAAGCFALPHDTASTEAATSAVNGTAREPICLASNDIRPLNLVVVIA